MDIARVKEFSVTEAAEAKRLAALMITDSVAREVVPVAPPALPDGAAAEAIAGLMEAQAEPSQGTASAEIVAPSGNNASVTQSSLSDVTERNATQTQ